MTDTKQPEETGLSDEQATVYRINSLASKISEAFEDARSVSRNEALWVAARCRAYVEEISRLRVHLAGTEASLAHTKERLAAALSAEPGEKQ